MMALCDVLFGFCVLFAVLEGFLCNTLITHQPDPAPNIDTSCENWATEPANCTRHDKLLKCYGGMSNWQTISVQRLRKIDELILCGWPESTFNPTSVMLHFPKVRVLKIEYSNFTDFKTDFPEMFYLEHVNISWTQVSNMNLTLFKKVHSLKVLDLRWNQLKHLEGPPIVSKSFETMFLSGNPWNCTRNIKWLANLEKSANIEDRDELICTDDKYQGRHLMTIMYYKTILRSKCSAHPDLQNCTCLMHYIKRSDDGKSLVPIYAVNCSSRNFESFPPYLPENTTIFYGRDNKISDMTPLRNNEHYRTVEEMYLDNNHVNNVDVLEAGFWLRHFRVLSLRGNYLNKMPVYALDNALEDNHNAIALFLSNNPWECECKFTMRLQEILMKYHTIIKDTGNVTCTHTDDEGVLQERQVLSLKRLDVCKVPAEMKIRPLDWLNIVLASLIILILGKLAYDYYHYKNYGRLPWIVTKLP